MGLTERWKVKYTLGPLGSSIDIQIGIYLYTEIILGHITSILENLIENNIEKWKLGV